MSFLLLAGFILILLAVAAAAAVYWPTISSIYSAIF